MTETPEFLHSSKKHLGNQILKEYHTVCKSIKTSHKIFWNNFHQKLWRSFTLKTTKHCWEKFLKTDKGRDRTYKSTPSKPQQDDIAPKRVQIGFQGTKNLRYYNDSHSSKGRSPKCIYWMSGVLKFCRDRMIFLKSVKKLLRGMIILKDWETLIYANSPHIDLYFQRHPYENPAVFPVETEVDSKIYL